MMRLIGFSSVAMALAVVCCSQAKAELPRLGAKGTLVAAKSEDSESKGIKVGDKAPAWEELTGTDDKPHSLKDLEKSKAVVVVFTCNTCPVAQAYEDRLEKLAGDYKEKGVEVVAINVNADERNNLDAMKQRAEKKGYTYAYITDPSQKIGREFGAVCTPHVFLLDGDQKVAYIGAIDDNMKADAVKKHHLKDAVDAVLAGKEVAENSTKPVGCGIRYE